MTERTGAAEPPLHRRRILVVEDDYMIAQDVCADLMAAGAIVLGPVPTVVQALHLLEGEERPDAAVLDVNLGRERSFPVAEVLQVMRIPFLFSTGYNSDAIPAEWQHVTSVLKPLPIDAVAALFAP